MPNDCNAKWNYAKRGRLLGEIPEGLHEGWNVRGFPVVTFEGLFEALQKHFLEEMLDDCV